MLLKPCRFKETKADVDQIEQRTEKKYKDDIEILEKRHKDQANRLNIMLEEKENIIQDEVKSASKRLATLQIWDHFSVTIPS